MSGLVFASFSCALPVAAGRRRRAELAARLEAHRACPALRFAILHALTPHRGAAAQSPTSIFPFTCQPVTGVLALSCTCVSCATQAFLGHGCFRVLAQLLPAGSAQCGRVNAAVHIFKYAALVRIVTRRCCRKQCIAALPSCVYCILYTVYCINSSFTTAVCHLLQVSLSGVMLVLNLQLCTCALT